MPRPCGSACISLPAAVGDRLRRLARSRGVSMSALVTEWVAALPSPPPSELERLAADPDFAAGPEPVTATPFRKDKP
jgi:hypothetical protein